MVFEDRSLAPYRGDKPYLFLSYSHRDSEQVERVIRSLKTCGFRVWYDEGLAPGKEWDENIATAIIACSYFIVLMSSNYLASANCRDELNYARDKSKPLLLLYLESVELPAGMELRLGRLLAIHNYKYSGEAPIYDKILKAEGIEICREAGAVPPAPPDGKSDSVPTRGRPRRRGLPTAVKVGIPLLLAAALALALRSMAKGQEEAVPSAPPVIETEAPIEAETPVVSEAPAEREAPVETEAPAVTEVPSEMEAPGETEAPAETEIPAETETPAETAGPTETEVPAETEPPPEDMVPAFRIAGTPGQPCRFLLKNRLIMIIG